jgi:hypothetical protein
MIKEFLIFKIDYLSSVDGDLDRVFELYNNHKLGLETALMSLLIKISNHAREYNDQDILKKVLSLQSTLKTAQQGIDPLSLEMIKLYKSTFIRKICYRIVNELCDYLTHNRQEVEIKIQKIRDLTSQLILAGLQQRVIIPADIKASYSKEEVGQLWSKLLNNGETYLFQQNLCLLANKQDVLYIFEDLLQHLEVTSG